MADTKLKKARRLIKKKPYLIWSTKNYDNLSMESILEAVMNYGDWNDFLKLKEIYGINELYLIFKNITEKKRINLRPSTANYFRRYFDKYAF